MTDIIIAVFSGVVGISTGVYAFLTWKLVSETKKMREVQTEPRVWVGIYTREESIHLKDLVIQNIGMGPAYNITFEIIPDFEYLNGKFLSNLNLFKDGLRYLAPNQKVQFFLTNMLENWDKKIKTPFNVGVYYQNSLGRKLEDHYTIDFSLLVGLAYVGEPPLQKIAKNVEEMQKDLGRVSSGFNRIKTIVYTKQDIDEEEKAILERIKQSREEEKKDS